MRIVVITPVYEDWKSFSRLVHELDRILAESPHPESLQVAVLAVDDGSADAGPSDASTWSGLKRISRVEILRLAANMGHQRAIALGAVHVVNANIAEAAVIMDADGEDKPADVLRLIDASFENEEAIVVAGRAKRSESLRFRLGYRIYLFTFRWLTGHKLPFGNFSLVPWQALARLVCNGDIWNHFSAAVSRAQLPVIVIPADRGTRYSGRSRMSWVTLAVHGLSAMSVYSDRVAARLIFASVCITIAALLAILSVAGIRFLTELAIPGWASQVVGSLIIVSLVSVVFAALLAFITLQARQQLTFFPKTDGLKYMQRVETWWPQP